MKRCLIIRLGAIGDLLFITPVLPVLKADGYHITINCKNNGIDIFKNNPYVDSLMLHDTSIKLDDLPEHWEKISEGYDKVINYSATVEQKYLVDWQNPAYYGDKSKRQTDVNFYDEMLRIAGYPDIKGRLPELYFDKYEEQWIKKQRKRYKGFIILWALSGSALHKVYPYTEDVAQYILKEYPDVWIITVGDSFCYALEWLHKRTVCRSGIDTIRDTLLRTKTADLVIGCETGVLNAAGCWDVPKIILYSHTKHENLSLYFKNVYPIHPDVECAPCYRMIQFDEVTPDARCNPIESVGGASVCMASIRPERVINAIESVIGNRMPGLPRFAEQNQRVY